MTLKHNGKVIDNASPMLKAHKMDPAEPIRKSSEQFVYFFGSLYGLDSVASGLTLEVYVVDAQGYKSNTVSTPPFEVTNSIATETYEITLGDCITLTNDNCVANKWVPETSFPVNTSTVAIAVKGLNPNGNMITKFMVMLKADGQYLLGLYEMEVSRNTKEFTQFIGSWNIGPAASNLTFELYAVDSNGKKSNTVTTPPFEVK